jgi:hypothetical protein
MSPVRAEQRVEDPAAPMPRSHEGPVERPSGLPGYEGAGEPMGIEDDA